PPPRGRASRRRRDAGLRRAAAVPRGAGASGRCPGGRAGQGGPRAALGRPRAVAPHARVPGGPAGRSDRGHHRASGLPRRGPSPDAPAPQRGRGLQRPRAVARRGRRHGAARRADGRDAAGGRAARAPTGAPHRTPGRRARSPSDTERLAALMGETLLEGELRERRRAHLTVARVSARAPRATRRRRRGQAPPPDPTQLLLADAVHALSVYRGPTWQATELELVSS